MNKVNQIREIIKNGETEIKKINGLKQKEINETNEKYRKIENEIIKKAENKYMELVKSLTKEDVISLFPEALKRLYYYDSDRGYEFSGTFDTNDIDYSYELNEERGRTYVSIEKWSRDYSDKKYPEGILIINEAYDIYLKNIDSKDMVYRIEVNKANAENSYDRFNYPIDKISEDLLFDFVATIIIDRWENRD